MFSERDEKREIKRVYHQTSKIQYKVGQLLGDFQWFSLFITTIQLNLQDITQIHNIFHVVDIVSIFSHEQVDTDYDFYSIHSGIKEWNGKKRIHYSNSLMSNYMYVPVHAFCLESPFTSSFKTVWISYNNFVWNKREQTMGPTRMREIIKKTQESLWYEFFVVCFIVTAFHHHKHKCNTQCLRFFIYSFISYILAYFFSTIRIFHSKST